ncbi:MAG: FAD-dependent oxidoreductase, partial [Planctomycetota bacterium]
VDILYASDVIGAECSDQTIDSVLVHNRSLTQKVAGDVFIDATGDGVLSRHAGGHPLPDDPQHPGLIKPSNMISMREADNPPDPPDDDVRCSDGVKPDYSVWPGAGDQVTLKMKLFHRDLDTSTGRGYSDAVTAMRGEIPAFADHFRSHHDESFVFAGSAPMLGLRESVRIEGDYVLTIADCRAGRRFDDAVAYGTFTVDANETSEILPPYQIPMRSLLVKDVENCLVVGRCFSADRLALSSARTMATGCLMGQAGGIAASLASGPELRAVAASDVRQRLIAYSDSNETMAEHLLGKGK